MAFQSIQRKWSVREPLDIGPPILALEDSLDYAEKDIAWRWHNHIFHCGFRCESDDPITGYQMKHIVAMLEETISNHLNPSAETDITRDITAALSSVTLAHRFTKSILFDQRQRIAPALLPDNQFSSTRYRLNRVSHPRKDPHTLNHLDMRDAFVPFIQNDGDLKGSSRANEPHRTHSRDPQADTKKQNVPHSLNKTSISFAETIPPAKPLRLRTSEEDSVQFPISNTADGDNRPQVQRVYRSASVSKRLPGE